MQIAKTTAIMNIQMALNSNDFLNCNNTEEKNRKKMRKFKINNIKYS